MSIDIQPFFFSITFPMRPHFHISEICSRAAQKIHPMLISGASCLVLGKTSWRVFCLWCFRIDGKISILGWESIFEHLYLSASPGCVQFNHKGSIGNAEGLMLTGKGRGGITRLSTPWRFTCSRELGSQLSV